jgi:hypothetical protein
VVSITRALAHKPGCPRYRSRLFRIGEIDVCRGCTFLWFGIFMGVLAAIGATFGALAASVLLAVGVTGLHPAAYQALPNPARDLTRFALGAGPVPFVVGAWRAGLWYPASIVLWLTGGAVWLAIQRRRAQPRRACGVCLRCRDRGVPRFASGS